MAIIVQHKWNEKRYIFLGAGISEFKSSRPGTVLGTLTPIEDRGRSERLAVCDEHGRIEWFDRDHLYVVSVDGKSPADVLLRISPEFDESNAGISFDHDTPASNDEIEEFLDD